MNWMSGFVLYAMIWWLTLFVVLPIGIRPAEEADDATGWRGAPKRPRLGMKVIVTTIVAAVLWLSAWVVIEYDLLSFRHGILAG